MAWEESSPSEYEYALWWAQVNLKPGYEGAIGTALKSKGERV